MPFLRFVIGIVWILSIIWVIYDVFAKNQNMSSGKKALWTILAILFGLITAIAYYLIEKR